MPTFTITEIEQAINVWRNRQPSGEDAALCTQARRLADIYGEMIYTRATVVDVASLTAEQEESDAHFTTAPGSFFEAWKQAVMVAGPVYFGDGTKEAVAKAKDKWALAPNGAIILGAFGVLSSGERTFLAALYSFYNTHGSVLLWEKAGIRGFADLSGLDLVRRKLIAEFLLNYVGW